MFLHVVIMRNILLPAIVDDAKPHSLSYYFYPVPMY